MLTRLRFKNWRSLKDVTIDDLTPLTVFIGANSSGKTNILEGIHMLRRFARDVDNDPQAIYFTHIQKANARTINAPADDPLEFEATIETSKSFELTYLLALTAKDSGLYVKETITNDAGETIAHGENGVGALFNTQVTYVPKEGGRAGMLLSALHRLCIFEPDVYGELVDFFSSRIQMLGENFSPSFSTLNQNNDSKYLIDNDTHNVVTILEYMQSSFPSQYAEFQNDLSWLLEHVTTLDIQRDERETQLVVREKAFNEGIAPTVSLGTERAAAMLAAYYALDMRQANLPGLIAIEEPDTALNPDILDKFVELLRTYTTRADRPRQFILTTHNPAFLDYFEPDEVRIVERDAEGFTSVRPIDDDVRKTLLTKYTLGEVWKMRALGAIPDA